MRVMLRVIIPHAKFNEAVKAGTAGQKMKAILDEAKPESVYFTETGGKRSCVMVVDIEDSSQIPALSEPWFLSFEADVQSSICMSPADLEASGLDTFGSKWG